MNPGIPSIVLMILVLCGCRETRDIQGFRRENGHQPKQSQAALPSQHDPDSSSGMTTYSESEIVELITDKALLHPSSGVLEKLKSRFPKMSIEMAEGLMEYSTIMGAGVDTLQFSLTIPRSEGAAEDSIFSGTLRKCTNTSKTFHEWDSILSARLGATKENFKQDSSTWDYTYLPAAIYNREHYCWIRGSYVYDLGWDLNDTGCVVLSLYRESSEGGE